MPSLLPSALALGSVALLALVLTVLRPSSSELGKEHVAASRVLTVSVLLLHAHPTMLQR